MGRCKYVSDGTNIPFKLFVLCGVILIPVVGVVVVPICSLQMQLADRYLRESNKTVNSESSTITINSQKNVEGKN